MAALITAGLAAVVVVAAATRPGPRVSGPAAGKLHQAKQKNKHRQGDQRNKNDPR